MRKRSQRKSQKFLEELGNSVRERRLSFELSQEELGALCGVHRSYITEIEGGSRNVSVLTLKNLADALKIETWQLMRFNGSDDGLKSQDGDGFLNDGSGRTKTKVRTET